MTNLCCTADHHAVFPLNIRPVENGIILTIFQPIEKLIPLTTTSQSRPDQPRCILDQHTFSPIKARSSPTRLFFQSGRERWLIGSLVWTGLNTSTYMKHCFYPLSEIEMYNDTQTLRLICNFVFIFFPQPLYSHQQPVFCIPWPMYFIRVAVFDTEGMPFQDLWSYIKMSCIMHHTH